MRESSDHSGQSSKTWRYFARHVVTIGENRLALLKVEIQEARMSLLSTVLMALGVATSVLLACATFTAAIVIGLWDYWSPVVVLLILTGLYGAVGMILYLRLESRLRDPQMLSATLDQLQKDRAGLREALL